MNIISGVLWTGTLLEWISHLSRGTINPFSWADCKLPYFLWYFFHHYSSLLLSAMSVKKVVALNFPLFERRCCNVRRAKVGTSLIALAVAALEVQFFFIIKEKTDNTGKEQCYFIRVPQSYILIFNRLDATLYSFYIFAVMGFTNIAIIYKFTKAKLSNRKKGTNSTAQALARSHMRDVATLVSVSVMFIVLTGPASAIYATTQNPHPTVATIVHVLATANHSVHAVVMCIVGSTFRRELVKTLHCCKKKRHFYDNRSRSGTRNSRLSASSLRHNQYNVGNNLLETGVVLVDGEASGQLVNRV